MANPLWKTAWCFQEIQDIEVSHDPAIPLMGLGPGKVKWNWLSCVWPFATLWTIQSVESPGQNTGVGSLSLLQGIFPTQGSSPGLPHCRQILYQLSHKGSPRILEWVAHPFSSVDLPAPGIELGSPALQTDSLPAEPQGKCRSTENHHSKWHMHLDFQGNTISIGKTWNPPKAPLTE